MSLPPAAKPPLSDPQTELTVLAACLLWKDDYYAACAEYVTAEDFSRPVHAATWNLLGDLPADLGDGIMIELRRRLVEGGGAPEPTEYFVQQLLEVPSGVGAPAFAKTIRKLSLARRQAKLLEQIRLSPTGLNGELDELRIIQEHIDDLDAGPKIHLPLPTPASELCAKAITPIEWLLEPVLAKGCLTFLQGEMKGGKSCFALLQAIAVASGRWASGRFMMQEPSAPRRTLFITYEDNERRLRRRIAEYCAGMSIDIPTNLLIYTNQDAPEIDFMKPGSVPFLKNLLMVNAIEALFLDTWSYLHSGDENSSGDMTRATRHLRQVVTSMNCATQAIHHIRKPGQKGDAASTAMKGRGSGAIAASADCIINFGARVSPNVTAVSTVSKDAQADDFNVAYQPQENGSIQWAVLDTGERENVREGKFKVVQILIQLRITQPDGSPVSDISELLPEVSDKSIKRYLAQLVGEQKVEITEKKGFGGSKHYRLLQ